MSKLIRTLTEEYIKEICRLYGDVYDDRVEDSRPPSAGKKNGSAGYREPGYNWRPGVPAQHKSLTDFQRELDEIHNIHLSTSKIRKVLISGGAWSTERSREIQKLFDDLTDPRARKSLSADKAVKEISKQLEVSTETVIIYLPYRKGVHGLDERSKNAIRCERHRKKKATERQRGKETKQSRNA